MNSSMIEVIFKVHARVSFGEEIYLIGNVPALGCNSIERAIPLVTSSSEFPWWRTKEAIFLPGDEGSVSYRYAVFSNGKFARWEGDLIRHVRVPKNKALCQILEDFFGSLEKESLDTIQSSPSKVVAINSDSSQRSRILSNWSRRSTGDQDIGKIDAVIIVSYFLPVILSKKSNGGWQASWDKENLLSMQMNTRTIWVGSIRYANAPIPVEEEEAVASILAAMNCFPVFVNQKVHHQFYAQYCKQHLWLILHHIADVYGPLNLADKSVESQQQMWFNYSNVHKLFREKVMEVYQPGYLIWIHGFHLLLLPSFLRRIIPQAKIGYFFHTPFPSSEIWRTMSRREDLLRGILGADQVGFHLYEYARHFMTCCHRLLGYNSDMNAQGAMTVNVDGREVAITCIHVGVDLSRVNEVFTSDPFAAEVQYWKSKFPNKVVISGIDRLERLKGIPLKLMAIDKFMQENPQWHGKVVFPFIGITASERGQDYRQTLHDVNIFVNQINDKYKATSNGPVIFFAETTDREIRLSHRLAYFAAADVLLMTATRDGLNRYPMEFTLARSMHGKLVESGVLPFVPTEGAGLSNQGLIIIGEFISSARVMRGAMIVNPWRVDDVKEVIKYALEMGPTDRADRSRRNLEFSTRLTTTNWAKHILNDLMSVERSDDPNSNYAVGFGLQYKIMNLKAGFLPLDVQEVCKSYRNTRHRLILLDWGGTLVPNVNKHDKLQAYAMATGAASREGISSELKNVLEILSSDPKNVVFVVSGKEVRTITDYFGGIRGLGLAAEHGFYYLWPQNDLASSGPEKAKWQTAMESVDDGWKASAKMVMDIFVQRTHGTYIEQKGNTLIWQYSDADPEFGFLQSKELEGHLKLIMANYRVEVLRGGGVADGYIEVRPLGASKGLFLDHSISTMRASNQEADFILAIGDDSSDEPMFERISLLTQEQSAQLHAYSVTVGKKPTEAKAYLDDPSGVLELLQSISKYSNRDRKFFSVVDLPSQAQSDISGMSSKSAKRVGFEQTTQKTGGLTRASSASQIFGLTTEPSHKATNESATARAKTTAMGQPAGVVGTLRPIASVSQISASEYLSSINDVNDEEDEGIFF